jgi:hypothetical protein
MQEAKLGEAHREQPRRKPETADANLLRHGSAPRFELLAILSLGFDVRLEDDFDIASERSSIRLCQTVQLFPKTWFDSEAQRHAPEFAAPNP